MLIGPIPPFFVERLREKLEDFAAEAKVYSSPEATAKFREKVLNRSMSQHPSFDTQEDLLYIEIPFNRLLMVKGELDQMGIPLTVTDFNPEFDRGEYLCPKCGFVAEAPALCPKHGVPLLEFSKWAEANTGRLVGKERSVYIAIGVLLLICVGSLVVNALQSYFHF